MPYSHSPVFPSHHDVVTHVSVRLFSSIPNIPGRRGQNVPAISRHNGHHANIHVSAIMRGGMQPNVRMTDVIVVDTATGVQHHFKMFFKNHRYLPINKSVRATCGYGLWRGDVVFGRVSSNDDAIVNLRSGDVGRINAALPTCMANIRRGTPPVIPVIVVHV